MPSKNLMQRILVAVIAIPAVVGVIWLGGWVLAGALALLGVLGTREVYDFARRQGVEPLERTGWLAAAAIRCWHTGPRAPSCTGPRRHCISRRSGSWW
jgi:CDP-diglyceride synthetase